MNDSRTSNPLVVALRLQDRHRTEAENPDAALRDRLFWRAADEIERLSADRDSWKSRIMHLTEVEQDNERLRAALDGTHFHHKAFEPLCSHCQAALREVTADEPSDVEFLYAQRAEVERLLDRTPESDPLGRLSFQSRLDAINADLDRLAAKTSP